MELDSVRKELNKYDNIIKNMINLRMALIPIVADVKKKNELPLVQKGRETEIYKKIEDFGKENGVSEDLLKEIYKLIISNALEIEHSYEKMPEIDNNVNFDIVSKEFEKLDNIIKDEIPEIILNIRNEADKSNLTLNEISTLYYNNKIN